MSTTLSPIWIRRSRRAERARRCEARDAQPRHGRARWRTRAMAPAWCARPSVMGTASSSVQTPSVACSTANSASTSALPINICGAAVDRQPGNLAERGQHHGIAQHAVVELHGQRILEQVEIPGRGFAEAGGHEGAVDQRPGVEAHAGIEPGHQRRRPASARRSAPAPAPATQAVLREREAARARSPSPNRSQSV